MNYKKILQESRVVPILAFLRQPYYVIREAEAVGEDDVNRDDPSGGTHRPHRQHLLHHVHQLHQLIPDSGHSALQVSFPCAG